MRFSIEQSSKLLELVKHKLDSVMNVQSLAYTMQRQLRVSTDSALRLHELILVSFATERHHDVQVAARRR